MTGWGIFREVTHSPGRETDDEQILRLTAKHVEGLGFPVVLKSPEDAIAEADVRPGFVFFMCERLTLLDRLDVWERAGIPHVNPVRGVLNTYRDRMLARFTEAGVPFVPSRLVATTQDSGLVDTTDVPVWVKRADVHNTQAGDVVRAETPGEIGAALRALAARGLGRAVIQPHVDGDLVKFYGVGRHATAAEPAWFQWFYHQHQTLAHHPFDPRRMARLARQAADALGLEVYGGDAIATAAGGLVLIDVNAWPSFARFREEAAARIAAHLAQRLQRGGR
ncbi:MAG: hypothetical protein HY216_00730 [Candidatus Rokubacteria bacterium]|nr:hypothetical protein [Candidatus Rokubacteria bacterium]